MRMSKICYMEGKMLHKDSMSLQGWEFAEWFKGNWKTIKEIIKVAVPALIGLVSTSHPALVGLITLTGKFVLDVGEYYLKEK
jgi:hypothetical protein